MAGRPRYYVTCGARTVVPKKENLAGVTLDALGFAQKGYSVAIKIASAIESGVVRVAPIERRGPIIAEWEPHPFARPDSPIPPWAGTAINLINEGNT